MNQTAIIKVPGLALDSGSRLGLDRLLRRMVNVMTVYSSEAPSRRIEGQFGGETMEEQFSDMAVYLQYSSVVQKREVVDPIIRKIYMICGEINRHHEIVNRIYLFNTVEEQIKLATRNRQTWQALDPDRLSTAIREFQTSKNIRILPRLDRFEENSLLVFITDWEGCELGEEPLKRLRRAKNQSIWVRIGDESMEIRSGFPEKNQIIEIY